jgi:hypothetical protein
MAATVMAAALSAAVVTAAKMAVANPLLPVIAKLLVNA